MKEQIETQIDEGVLSRWSRRKQEARVADESTEVVEVAEVDSALMPVVEQEVQLTDADMPPLDSLDSSSDFSGFLSPKVSEQLRQMALRKLFHAAVFNTTDGLDDYAEDYTSFEKLGDIITSDMRFEQAMDEERRLEKERLAEIAEIEQEKESELAQATSADDDRGQVEDIMEDAKEGLSEETPDDEFDESEIEV